MESGGAELRRRSPRAASRGATLLLIGALAGLMTLALLLSESTPPHGVDRSIERVMAPPAPAEWPVRSLSKPYGTTADQSLGRPVAVAIPALGVEARVVPVSADAAGTLVPPADAAEVGWWSDGAWPGAGSGRILLTGHTLGAGGGAFDDLASLEVGSTVEVVTEAGAAVYSVLAIDHLAIEQVADRAWQLFGSAGPERLVLVTCSDWDGERYRGNTVVTASRR